jgi:hypothetical protein
MPISTLDPQAALIVWVPSIGRPRTRSPPPGSVRLGILLPHRRLSPRRFGRFHGGNLPAETRTSP